MERSGIQKCNNYNFVDNIVIKCDIFVFTDDNCCIRCLRCLARVPCATLSCWVFMIMSVSACAGAIMIGSEKTRQMLDKEDD